MLIHSLSHLDHGLTPAHLAWIAEQIGERDEPFVETFTLPPDLPSLASALYGPTMGDAPIDDHEVTWAARGDRRYKSRLVARPARETRDVTVVGGPYEGAPCVLFTAYGGPAAPRELWAPGIERDELPALQAFWSQHALAA